MKKEIIWVIFIIIGVAAIGSITVPGEHFPSFNQLFAQVGITVGIAPNPYNTLNAQLDQKQTELDQQQADLAAREAEFASSTANSAEAAAPFAWYLAGAVLVLALLIGFNFYLDWRRARRERKNGDAIMKE